LKWSLDSTGVIAAERLAAKDASSHHFEQGLITASIYRTKDGLVADHMTKPNHSSY